jgi:anti-sigma factor RsiW
LGNWAQGPNLLLPPLTESAVPSSIRDSMQRAAEAEMLHQKTRELYGPAAPPADNNPPAPPPAAVKPADKPKETPPAPASKTKKPPMVEIRTAEPQKKSFWSRFRTDKTRA